MTRVKLTGPARSDIKGILRASELDFGRDARARYRSLIDQAIRDIAADVGRRGVHDLEDARPGYFAYHLRSSRANVSGPTVRSPRHLIAFYLEDQATVVIARILHERQLLQRHLED